MPPRRLKLAVALFLVAAVVAVFHPVLGHDFVNYDDDRYITHNRNVEAGLTREGAAWAFGSFHGANWFPITRLSWMLDAEIFGIDPKGFHLTNLLLHAASSVLLFLAFLRLTRAPWRSAFVAAVFALHPLHVESVAWASERKDMLSGLFLMLTLLVYEAYARRGATWPRYWLLLACVALGLMSKPTLVTLPLLLLLVDEWPLRRLRRPESPLRWDPARVRRAVEEKLPLLALSGIASIVTLSAQRRWGSVQALDRLPLAERLENAAVAYVTYLGKAFWPSDLAIFYPHPAGGISSGAAAGAAALLLAITVGLALGARRRPAPLVGWLWFLGMLVPMIGVVQVGAQARADRYMYLPLIGLTVSVAWGVADLVGTRPLARRAAAAVAGVALLAMAIASSVQVRTWKDSIHLFERALRVTARNDLAHRNLGHALLGAGHLDAAAHHLEESLRIAPHSATGRALLGAVRIAQDRPDEAIDLYREALEQDPGRRPWLETLARLYGEVGRHQEAIHIYRRALKLAPRSAPLRADLGLAQFEAGRTQAAIVSYERALKLSPGLAVAHLRLGQALEATGRGREAIPHYRQALRRGSASPVLLNNLAWLLATTPGEPQKSSEEAIALAERAAEATEQRNPGILDTLARAQAAAGRYADAERTASRALRLAEAQKRRALAAELRLRLAAYAAGRTPD